MKVRRIIYEDLPIRVGWMNDSRIYANMGFKPPITLEGTIEWFNRNLTKDDRIDVTYVDDDDNIIGFGGITLIDWTIRCGETYTFINPDLHHQGFGTRANRLLIDYAFNVMKLNKIVSHVDAPNIASRKVREKLGFKLEGILRDAKYLNGAFVDRYYYGLLCREYVSPDIQLDKICIEDYTINIVRDDLFAQSGGGIKSRKSVYYQSHMLAGGYNACVTTGGIQSNHNRAIALMCARNGWRCHIVYHGTRERFESEKGNALLVRNSGVSYEFVEASEIGHAMDVAMERLTTEGYRPMYIHGGGHDLPGGIALVEAVKTLKDKCDTVGYKPDYIFHASGTGSTQAGIVVGLDRIGWNDVKVVGISVARQYERGRQVIADFANMLAAHYDMHERYDDRIIFNTDYLCGGYEQYTHEMEMYLQKVMHETGIMFDTTYSGKAFYGMMDFINKNHLLDKKILFWHTGGLMNLMI